MIVAMDSATPSQIAPAPEVVSTVPRPNWLSLIRAVSKMEARALGNSGRAITAKAIGARALKGMVKEEEVRVLANISAVRDRAYPV